jgi:hypothetical protein
LEAHQLAPFDGGLLETLGQLYAASRISSDQSVAVNLQFWTSQQVAQGVCANSRIDAISQCIRHALWSKFLCVP